MIEVNTKSTARVRMMRAAHFSDHNRTTRGTLEKKEKVASQIRAEETTKGHRER